MSDIKAMLMNLKPKVSPFHVEAWGADIHIRALTEKERKDVEPAEDAEISHTDQMKSVCLLAIVREDGSQIFDSLDEMEHLTLGGFTQIYSRVVGLTMGTLEEAKKS